MTQEILQFIGPILFLGTGYLLGLFLFKKLNVLERISFSVGLSIGYFGLWSIFLYLLGLYSKSSIYILSIISIFVFIFILFINIKKYKNFKDDWHNSIISVFSFSILGVVLRFIYQKYFELNSYTISDPYAYSFGFIDKNIPDLGFYSGIARDKSLFFGNFITENISSFFYLNGWLVIFLANFFYLSFIYLFIEKISKDKYISLFTVAIMFIGPIELFYSANSIFGHPLSYLIIPVFLLGLVTNTKNYSVLTTMLCLTMLPTYYTSGVIIALISIGLLISILIKDLLEKEKKIKEIFISKIFLKFSIILIISSFYIIFLSGMTEYSIDSYFDKSNREIFQSNIIDLKENIIDSKKNTTLENQIEYNSIYKDPQFIFLSAIRWQMLFLALCFGIFTLIIFKKIIKKEKIDEKEKTVLLILIPIILISLGFWHVNLPTRIFNYLCFFFISLLTFILVDLSDETKKNIYILTFVFFVLTTIFVVKDKKAFLTISKEEISSARKISLKGFEGKIFSDQVFINQLILSKYYNVTGANDKDQLVKNIFFQNNENVFKDAIKILRNNGVTHIAVTKRMSEKYILMLNYPQKKLITEGMFKKLEKTYDDGIVVLYKL